jgi:hypothetical protein
MVSELRTILDTFESRSDINLIHRSTDTLFADYLRNKLPEIPGNFGIMHDSYVFWIAPKQGIYTVDELQEFMMGLFPELEPKQMEPVTQTSRYMKAGSLFFYEVAAESVVRLEITVFDEELYANGKETVKKEDTISHTRSMRVVVFPHQDVGRYVLAEGCGYGNIPLREVRGVQRSQQPSVLERLTEYLQM